MLIAGALILIVTVSLFGWLFILPYRLNVKSDEEARKDIHNVIYKNFRDK